MYPAASIHAAETANFIAGTKNAKITVETKTTSATMAMRVSRKSNIFVRVQVGEIFFPDYYSLKLLVHSNNGVLISSPLSLLMHTALHDALRTYGHERLELEFRLGHTIRSFVPGVSRAHWMALRNVLDDSPAWTRTYKETVERIHQGHGRESTRKTTDANTMKEEWMGKKRLADEDNPGEDCPWTIRTSLSMEVEVQPDPALDMSIERRKCRWSYYHKGWSFDMTLVQGNAGADLDEDITLCEIELELADHDLYFKYPLSVLTRHGTLLVQDACRFMMTRVVTKNS